MSPDRNDSRHRGFPAAILLPVLLVLSFPLPAQIHEPPAVNGNIVINELFYAPASKTTHEEFIELYNKGGGAVDLSGWFFSDGVSYTFPAGTTLGPGQYLVIAEYPGALASIHGVGALGPCSGKLDSDGEALVLRNAAGAIEDRVEYQNGFPWPTTGRPADFSAELLHPDLDNDLGGSWRSSSPGLVDSTTLVQSGESWRYFKGTQAPPSTWKSRTFNDTGWLAGRAPLGYGEAFIATELADMRGNYSTVYLRKTFQVDDPSSIRNLALEVLFDDGFNAWINGTYVAGDNVSSADLPFTGIANGALENLNFVEFDLPPPGNYLVAGANVLAIQVLNSSLDTSSDAFLDARLLKSAGGAGPTPGAQNSVYAENIPPQLRQVEHSPEEPFGGSPVLVTVKATDPDGVSAVLLEYQIVEPGAYIRLTDPEYEMGWTALAMNDAGLAGDALAGDEVFSVLVPESVQEHRRLIRYRITATDGTGLSVKVPYADDPQPNFAYFVHDGVPPWTGSARPGVAQEVTYDPDVLSSVPVYHFITHRQDHLNALHVPYRWGRSGQQNPTSGEYWGEDYPWLGTLVYEGKVYDHVAYRARGGVWRYSMGKNMWKFDFLRGHYFEAKDDHGRKYRTPWDKMNFSAIIQQGNFGQRGEQGLFEAVGFKLHNLAANPASLTHFAHFRVIEGADEYGPDQYSGDFQGLYLVIEQPDGRMLDEHELADGNLYKMEGGTGELNNQGPTHPTDKSDLNLFMGTYLGGSATVPWWEQNLDVSDYCSFRAIMMAIHDYDKHAGKNYFYYNNPETAKWQVLTWDLDLTWTTTYGGGGGADPLNQYVLDPFPQMQLQYRNRVRELCDLLFNPDQTGQLIDEAAGIIYKAGQPSLVDADRAMWDYNPILVSSYVNPEKAGHGRFYGSAATRDFAGMIRLVKTYVTSRQQWMLSNQAPDSAIPTKPVVTSTAPARYPIDALTFRSSAFADPQGAGTFGGMKWRIAKVAPAGTPAFVFGSPRPCEIDAAWESDVLTPFNPDVQIPPEVPEVGATYRVRVRMMDNTGRWSNWSNPVEFMAGEPSSPPLEQSYLRVTELMYHPPYDEELEFVELQNIGPVSLDLGKVSFADGIEFRFAEGDVQTLAPGEHVVVVADREVFEAYYDTSGILIAGEYGGRFSNGGETVVLVHGASSLILAFRFQDWFLEADGLGRSLSIVDPGGAVEAWSTAEGWVASKDFGGSPGRADGAGPVGGFQRPGDSNQDGVIDISDGLALLVRLFGGAGSPLPCEGDLSGDGGNVSLLDVDGNGRVDLTDAIYILQYLFQGGPAPVLGAKCTRIVGCPSVCRP